jgi:hypothetical protein
VVWRVRLSELPPCGTETGFGRGLSNLRLEKDGWETCVVTAGAGGMILLRRVMYVMSGRGVPPCIDTSKTDVVVDGHAGESILITLPDCTELPATPMAIELPKHHRPDLALISSRNIEANQFPG